jgi:hypothetical protein
MRREMRPESISNPLRGSNSDLAQYSNTPSLRVAGFEDEDDDEDEDEIPMIFVLGRGERQRK